MKSARFTVHANYQDLIFKRIIVDVPYIGLEQAEELAIAQWFEDISLEDADIMPNEESINFNLELLEIWE